MTITKTFTDGDDSFSVADGNAYLLRFFAGDDELIIHNGTTTAGMGSGNDRVLIDGGTATISGGLGDDLYQIGSGAAATIIEKAGEGIDTVKVQPGMSYTLGANLENLGVMGGATPSSMATLTGNGLANHITGSGGADTIHGLGGNDKLYGRGGNDVIAGGDGNDRICGGAGADNLTGGAGADTFVYTSAHDSPSPNWDLSGADFITDWNPLDSIDLSAIDANSHIAGNQAFHFAGYSFAQPAGPQDAGSLIIGGFGGELYVSLYIAGGATPDMVISLWSTMDESGLRANDIIM
jgi:Ca2+-binding RTX toxin-like protein